MSAWRAGPTSPVTVTSSSPARTAQPGGASVDIGLHPCLFGTQAESAAARRLATR